MRFLDRVLQGIFAGCFCLAAWTAAIGQAAASAPATAGQVLRPALLPEDIPLSNPMSGLYANFFQSPKTLTAIPTNNGAPWPAQATDIYERFSWHSLELAGPGIYNFALIDAVLDRLPPGDRFGFRIMALNPQTGSDTNVGTGIDGYPVYADVPIDLETTQHGWLLPVDPHDRTQGHYFIPDWNDPVVLGRMNSLLAALGRRYDGDPRIAWVDIGLYGNWGEWHTAGLPDAADYKYGIPYAANAPYFSLNQSAYQANKGVAGAYQAGTVASKTSIVAAHVHAFPKTQLVMLTDDGDALCYALKLPDSPAHIGLRRDSLGSSLNSFYWQFPDKLPGCDTPEDVALLLNRWTVAPFVGEPYGNGSSPTFPCQTFEQFLAADGSSQYNCSVAQWNGRIPNYCIDQEVLQFHIANIKNASLCAAPWATYSPAQQLAFRDAALRAGYRFVPAEITLRLASDTTGGGISIRTEWYNAGITPAYNDWTVEFSLWPIAGGPAAARFISTVDLRRILPTAGVPVTSEDYFPLPKYLQPGNYELRIAVRDPNAYLRPMLLALKQWSADGSYVLGTVTVPKE